MKISLRKLVENAAERDPERMDTEAKKFLIFLKNNNGYGDNPLAWGNIFAEFNERAAQEFIKELIVNGWIKKDYINHLDLGIFITEKTDKLLGPQKKISYLLK